MRGRLWIVLAYAMVTSPALAQVEPSEVDHSEMDHSKMDHSQMDHSQMDHSQMDHSQMGHQEEQQAQASDHHDHSDHSNHSAPADPPDQSDHSDHATHADHAGQSEHSGHGQHDMATHPMPHPPQSPQPHQMQSGPPNAADAIWGADAMRKSRAALYSDHGDMALGWVQGDRLEYRARSGADGFLWDVQGYYGKDIDKFWFKSEGEGSFGEPLEQAEVQALWSHAIGPFFDLQTGVRQDFHASKRTHLVIGVQGVAPYFLEVDMASFLSNKGDLTARLEGEYDQRLTQKLILQPRAEINLSAQDIPELEIGKGLDSLEAGLRMRYEFTPEFGPYIGIEQEWKLGGSRDYAIAHGEDPSVTNFVIGLRFWF